MEMSLILFGKIVQLFIMLLMGWTVVKAGLLKSSDSRVLSVLLVYLISPCVIFRAFQVEEADQAVRGLVFTLIVAAAVHLLYVVLTKLLSKPLRLEMPEKVAVIYTNASFLIIPLVESLLGPSYVIYTCGYIVVETIMLWTHSIWMLNGGKGMELRKILTNVNVISIMISLIFLALKIQLPSVLSDTMSSVSATVGPLGMFLAGMVIAGNPLLNIFKTPRNYLVSALRLIVYPLILILIVSVLPLTGFVADGKNVLMVVMLASISPVCTTIISQLQLYELDADKASQLYILTTLFSMITMPVMIGVYDMLV